MDIYERIGYACLAVLALGYLAAILFGMIAVFPAGLIGLVALVGLGVLFVKVVRERLRNKEDDYYARNVDK